MNLSKLKSVTTSVNYESLILYNTNPECVPNRGSHTFNTVHFGLWETSASFCTLEVLLPPQGHPLIMCSAHPGTKN